MAAFFEKCAVVDVHVGTSKGVHAHVSTVHPGAHAVWNTAAMPSALVPKSFRLYSSLTFGMRQSVWPANASVLSVAIFPNPSSQG